MHRLLLAIGLAASLAPTAAAAPNEQAVDPPPPAAPAPLPSARVKGLERFDHVALLEAGVLCGTQIGHAPVCAADPQGQKYAAPYEALDDVAKLQALGLGHCVLFGSGELRCLASTAQAVAEPATWPILRTDVTDFVISAGGNETRVFALDRERALHVYRLDADPKRMASTVVAANVRSFGSRDYSGACAVVDGGDVLCSDPKAPDGELQPTGFYGAAAVFDGGAIIRTDGTFAYVIESWKAFAPWPTKARAYGYQMGCVITPRGGVECANTVAPWVKVALPAAAVRLAPSGYISCARLVDHTTACYGPFVAQIEQLAKRPRRTGPALRVAR